MRLELVPIKQLSGEMKAAWLNIMEAHAPIFGPCYHPDLFRMVGDILPDIQVAVLYKNNRISGFMPFLRDEPAKKAKWIEMCFCQGIISSPSHRWNLTEILRKCNLNSWEVLALGNFDGIYSFRGQFIKKDLPYVDLSEGWDKYLQFLKNRKSDYRALMYCRRLVERRVGPLRFVPICDDTRVLQRLVPWKLQRINPSEEWTRVTTGILDRLFHLKNSSLSGHLSALYAGETLISAGFSLRYHDVFQFYVFSFDPDYARYSPGMLLLYDLLAAYKTLKFKTFEFGAGKERFKRDFSNCAHPIIEGTLMSETLKEKIKSKESLYRYIRPVTRVKGMIVNKFKKLFGTLKTR